MPVDSAIEARLFDQRAVSRGGGAINIGDLAADGRIYVDSSQKLRLLTLPTLEVQAVALEPLRPMLASPTSNPGEYLVRAAIVSPGSCASTTRTFVYAHAQQSLAAIDVQRVSGDRFIWIPSLQANGVTADTRIEVHRELPATAPAPVSEVLGGLLEEANKRKLAALEQQLAAERGDAGVALRHRLAPGGSLAGVRPMPGPVADAARNAQIEAVGVYEGQGAAHRPGEARTTGIVEVRVRRSSRPIVLVLGSYEPVRWLVVTESGAHVAPVLRSGYHTSTIVGAGAARIVNIGQVYAYKRGDANYQNLEREVSRWTGRRVDLFRGAMRARPSVSADEAFAGRRTVLSLMGADRPHTVGRVSEFERPRARGSAGFLRRASFVRAA